MVQAPAHTEFGCRGNSRKRGWGRCRAVPVEPEKTGRAGVSTCPMEAGFAVRMTSNGAQTVGFAPGCARTVSLFTPGSRSVLRNLLAAVMNGGQGAGDRVDPRGCCRRLGAATPHGESGHRGGPSGEALEPASRPARQILLSRPFGRVGPALETHAGPPARWVRAGSARAPMMWQGHVLGGVGTVNEAGSPPRPVENNFTVADELIACGRGIGRPWPVGGAGRRGNPATAETRGRGGRR